MKIVHIVGTTHANGGLENVTLHLAQEQCAMGHEVYLVAHESFAPKVEGTRVTLCPFDFSASRNNPWMRYQLNRLLKSLSPDILHLQANKAAYLGSRLGKWAKSVKTVATIHNTKKTVAPFKGHDAVIAVSQRAGKALGDIPHQVIWNGVNIPSRSEAPLFTSQTGRFTVCSYGRFVPVKGYDLLLEAVAMVDEVDLWLIGDGELRPSLEQKVKDLGLEERVWMPGFREDAMHLAAASDVFVMSSHKEGFPLTIIEMLHLRQPILSTIVAGVEEILPSECIVPETNAQSLAERIAWAKANPDELKCALLPIYELASCELTVSRMAEKVDAVYKSL